MVELHYFKINNEEIKSTNFNEIMKFIKRYKKESISYVLSGMVEVPRRRLDYVIKNVNVEELYKWGKKKNNIPENLIYESE